MKFALTGRICRLFPAVGMFLCLTSACQAAPVAQAAPKPAATSKKTPILIAENAKAQLPVVIAPNASEGTKAVAAELAGYLKRITGAEFEFETGDGSSGIVLGTLREFPVEDLKKSLEIRNIYDGKEAYAIRTEAKRVLLLGATDLGASHAAFRFLETLGCRWFFPAPEWEVIPSKSTLNISLAETSRPAVLSRHFWWSFGLYASGEELNKPKPEWRLNKEWAAWQRHNRHAESFTVFVWQGYGGIYEANQKEFDAHPEYLALLGGKRVGWKWCLSNPRVRQMAVDWVLDYFVKNPNEDMVTLEPNDGGGSCECEECAKLGSTSDRVFGLANEAARALQKTHPGKLIGMLAYYEHSDPPSFKVEPNVHVQLATLYTQGKYTFDQQLELWPEHSTNMGIYDYFSTWVWGQDRLRAAPATGPGASLNYIKTNIPRFVAHGAKSFDSESSNCWGQYGLGYYIANKLLWNPKADADALVKDFYEKAFGPAAPAMQRFYERISPDSQRLYGKDFLGRAYRDVQEAGHLAAGHADVEARINDLKLYLYYNYLYWQYENAGDDKDKRTEAMVKLLTHTYRTRYSSMIHAAPAITQWSEEVAKAKNDPTWNSADPSPHKPWQVDTPYTQEEIEKEFQEGLQFFQPQTVTERTFSEDLVPVNFLDTYKPVPDAWAVFYEPRPFTVQSLHGEPIRVSARVDVLAQETPVKYTLKDSKGNVVTQGEFMTQPKTVKSFPLELKVPGPGLYELAPSSIALNFIFAPGVPTVAKLPRERGLHAFAAADSRQWYVYVPKGTKEISLYLSGYRVQFNDPDGKPIKELMNSSYKYDSVTVPPGMDGKVWGIEGRIEVLVFMNIPNVVALSPDASLLPRDLAEKDGLTIRQ